MRKFQIGVMGSMADLKYAKEAVELAFKGAREYRDKYESGVKK